MFGANLLETDRVVLSLALHRNVQAFGKNHIFEQRDTQNGYLQESQLRSVYMIIILYLYHCIYEKVKFLVGDFTSKTVTKHH